jgi:hypothetical protein
MAMNRMRDSGAARRCTERGIAVQERDEQSEGQRYRKGMNRARDSSTASV